MANFGGLVSVDETNTLDALWETRRIAREELAAHGGWLFGMPGDGIFEGEYLGERFLPEVDDFFKAVREERVPAFLLDHPEFVNTEE